MIYEKMDFKTFSDWQQVLAETNKSLSYKQCQKIKTYIESYQAACLTNNPNHVMPTSFLDASNRLNERIQHHEASKKPFIATYIIPIITVVIGAVVTVWMS